MENLNEMAVYETVIDNMYVTMLIDLDGPLCTKTTVDHDAIDRTIIAAKKELDAGKTPFHLFDNNRVVGRIRYIA